MTPAGWSLKSWQNAVLTVAVCLIGILPVSAGVPAVSHLAGSAPTRASAIAVAFMIQATELGSAPTMPGSLCAAKRHPGPVKSVCHKKHRGTPEETQSPVAELASRVVPAIASTPAVSIVLVPLPSPCACSVFAPRAPPLRAFAL